MSNFNQLDGKIVSQVISVAQKKPCSTGIVLTDGMVLIGDLGPRLSPRLAGATTFLDDEFYTKAKKKKGYPFIIANHIILSLDYEGAILIAVPFEKVAAIYQIPQEVVYADGDKVSSARVLSGTARQTMEAARKHGFRITGHAAYLLRPGKPTSIEFKEDMPLYADWDYFSNRAGGLNSIGISVFGFGGSVGGERSLFKELKRYTSNKPHSTEEILSGPSYIQHVVLHGRILPLNGKKYERYMEGSKWTLFIFTPIGDVSTADQAVGKNDWLPAFLNPECFLYPIEDFSLIKSTYHVAGESIPYNLPLNDQAASRAIKVRAIYFKRKFRR